MNQYKVSIRKIYHFMYFVLFFNFWLNLGQKVLQKPNQISQNFTIYNIVISALFPFDWYTNCCILINFKQFLANFRSKHTWKNFKIYENDWFIYTCFKKALNWSFWPLFSVRENNDSFFWIFKKNTANFLIAWANLSDFCTIVFFV